MQSSNEGQSTDGKAKWLLVSFKSFDLFDPIRNVRLLEKQTPWTSIWTTSVLMFFNGVQKSVYLTSTWPYLTSLGSQASVDLFGWAYSVGPLGAAISAPLLGYWTQRTLSTKHPVTMGFFLCALGNLLYAVLPILPDYLLKFILVASRFLIGAGTGNLVNLRSFVATASTSNDRVRSVSIGTAGYTAGFSFGPAVQMFFLPLGVEGYSFFTLLFNAYTSTAFFMVLMSVLAMALTNLILAEDYAGIVTDEEKKEDPFLVIPKYNRLTVVLLFFYCWVYSSFASTEGLASTFTMAMYNWNSEEAVFFNGILQTINCVINTLTYIVIAFTRFGKLDCRVHLLMGFLAFLSFYMIHLPWPFYEEQLDKAPLINGSISSNLGGCVYDWCENTPRVPKFLYFFAFSILFGLAFPLVSNPMNSILSMVIGPRKQGLIQGFFAFTGSVAQFIIPISSSIIFEATGYGPVMAWHAIMLIISLFLLFLNWKRFVPLCLTPPIGLPTKYKSGTLYRL